MMCSEWEVRLNEYVDGTLAVAERLALEGHLAGCAGCRAAVADLRGLVAGARGLPRTIQPSQNLWGGIATRIAVKRWWQRRTLWGGALAAAAVLVIVLGIYRATTHRFVRPAGNGWAVVEADYRRAALDLTDALAAQRHTLRPETVAVIDRNVRVIDAAIGESSAALVRDPDNAELRQLFAAAYRQKVDLLKWATRIATPAS